MPSPEAFGPASLAVGTATTAFMGFLPSFSEVRRADPDDEGMSKDIKLGQIAACAVGMGTGLIASTIVGSYIPFLVASLMCALLVWCYYSARKAV